MSKTKRCPNGHENDINAYFCLSCGLTFPDFELDKDQDKTSELPPFNKNIESEKIAKAKPKLKLQGSVSRRVIKIITGLTLPLLAIAAYLYFNNSSSNGDVSSIADSAIILRLSGSSTLGSDLIPYIAKQYLETKHNAKDVKIIVDQDNDKEIGIVGESNGAPIAIRIHAGGSSIAFKHLISDSCDIGLSSRTIRETEVTDNINHTSGSEHIIALDGIAIIVNEENPLTKISGNTVGEIFSGRKTEWAEITNYFGTIQPVTPDNSLGTNNLFEDMIFTASDQKIPDNAKRVSDVKKISSEVAKDKFAIGAVSYSKVEGVKALDLIIGANKSIQPSTYSISCEDYQLTRRLYLYLPINSAKKEAQDFINYCYSPEAQEIVKSKKFISIIPDCIKSTNPITDSTSIESYLNLYKSSTACRISTNLRFKSAKNELDSKAIKDIDRIITLVRKQTGRTIILCGFTNNTGNSSADFSKSFELLNMAKKEFEVKGMRVELMSCGSTIQIANNSTEVGKNKNRRVEVWIR